MARLALIAVIVLIVVWVGAFVSMQELLLRSVARRRQAAPNAPPAGVPRRRAAVRSTGDPEKGTPRGEARGVRQQPHLFRR